MYLDKIPNLSEHFIYSNDDMFFYRALSPEDFFSANGQPIVWLSSPAKMDIKRARSILNDPNRSDWGKALINAWIAFHEKRHLDIPYYVPAHTVDALSKKILQQIFIDYPNLRKINSSPFRSGNRIHRLLFSYEMISTYGCKIQLRKKTNFIFRLIASILPLTNYVAVSRENLNKLKRDLKLFHPKTFCMNNISEADESNSVEFLNSLWPSPAPWEK